MLGATVMINREPIGHVEVVRIVTSEDGDHSYRYKLYENGSVITYGNISHKESDGPYVLLHKAIGECLKDRW